MLFRGLTLVPLSPSKAVLSIPLSPSKAVLSIPQHGVFIRALPGSHLAWYLFALFWGLTWHRICSRSSGVSPGMVFVHALLGSLLVSVVALSLLPNQSLTLPPTYTYAARIKSALTKTILHELVIMLGLLNTFNHTYLPLSQHFLLQL